MLFVVVVGNDELCIDNCFLLQAATRGERASGRLKEVSRLTEFVRNYREL